MNHDEKIYDLIILGGGCAGLTAGIYAGRSKLRTMIIEKQQAGGQASTTDEIANYPGFFSIKGPELMERMLAQAKSFGTEFLLSDVTQANLSKEIKEIATESGIFKSYAVILATGANPKKIGFAGEEEFTGRGIGYCATCEGFFFEGKDIFVLGGGYSAVQEALYLVRFGKKVKIMVRSDKFNCAQLLIDKALAHPKIEVFFNTEIVRVYGDVTLQGAVFKNNKSNEVWEYKVSDQDGNFGIFIFIGYKPASELFQDQIELDQAGYVITNEKMETEISGVYAAGDLRPKILRQLVTAAADGAVAVLQAEKYIAKIKEKYGDHSLRDSLFLRDDDKEIGEDNITPRANLFSKLKRNITFVTITEPNNLKSEELANFIRKICELSDYLKFSVYTKGQNLPIEKQINLDRIPVVALLDDQEKYTGVKFCGIPEGLEFDSLIQTISNLAGSGQPVEEKIRQRIKNIKEKVRIEVVIALSCHFCPEAVIAAFHLAILNEYIEAEMIDISLFPELQQQYNIMSVPAVIINQKNVIFGAQSLEKLLNLIEDSESDYCGKIL